MESKAKLRALIAAASPLPWAKGRRYDPALWHEDEALTYAAVNALPGLLDALAAAERERDAVLEEAAGVCIERSKDNAVAGDNAPGQYAGEYYHRAQECEDCAAAIRALKNGGKP